MARRSYGKLGPERPREYRDTIDYEDGTSEPVEYYQGADPEHAIAVTNPDTWPCFYVYRVSKDEVMGRGVPKWELDHVNPVEPRDVAECERRRRLIREHFVLYDGTTLAFGSLKFQVNYDLSIRDEGDADVPAPKSDPAPVVREPVERIKTNKTRFFGVSFNI